MYRRRAAEVCGGGWSQPSRELLGGGERGRRGRRRRRRRMTGNGEETSGTNILSKAYPPGVGLVGAFEGIHHYQ